MRCLGNVAADTQSAGHAKLLCGWIKGRRILRLPVTPLRVCWCVTCSRHSQPVNRYLQFPAPNPSCRARKHVLTADHRGLMDATHASCLAFERAKSLAYSCSKISRSSGEIGVKRIPRLAFTSTIRSRPKANCVNSCVVMSHSLRHPHIWISIHSMLGLANQSKSTGKGIGLCPARLPARTPSGSLLQRFHRRE